MLYFSNRELKILRLLFNKPAGVSLEELMSDLDVSRRTVYRDLASLGQTLQTASIQLKKDGRYYQIQADEQPLQSLKDQVFKPLPLEWTDNHKRQIAILAYMALTDQELRLEDLAVEFDVSESTIQQDIAQLNEDLPHYQLEVYRPVGGSLAIRGSEFYLRLYLSQHLSRQINALDFFRSMEAELLVETESSYYLYLLEPATLQMIYQAIAKQQAQLINRSTDEALMEFIILLAISLARLTQEKTVELGAAVDHNQVLPYLQQVLSIVKDFSPAIKPLIETHELTFFALQLRGMNVRKNHSIFQESYDPELAYNVKYLIRLVSKGFGVNFNLDHTLYQDLINHIGAALKRLDLGLPQMENQVLAKLQSHYQGLYQVIEEKLREVFSPLIFSDQEIGYVLTHFASSYEKLGRKKDLRVLVVCTSGIGTSKILKSRIESSVVEIKKVDVLGVSDLPQTDLSPYQLIYSTIILPGFDQDYTVIDPILDEKNLQLIQDQVRQLKPKLGPALPRSPRHEMAAQTLSFDQVKAWVDLTDDLVQNFQLIQLESAYQTLEAYIYHEFTNQEALIAAFIRRLKLSPLAIPQSGLMLLHATESSCLKPQVLIHQLPSPIDAMGMDHQPTLVDRVVVMTGPADMTALETQYLGAISSSLIEEESYTRLYQCGQEADIQALFKTISINHLRNLLEKGGP